MSYLLEENEEVISMRQNIIQLLTTDQETNFELAIQLIEGGGMHRDFFLPMWIKYFAFTLKPELRNKIKKLAKKIFDFQAISVLFHSHLENLNRFIYGYEPMIKVFQFLCNEKKIYTWNELMQSVLPFFKEKKIIDYFLLHDMTDKKILLSIIIQNNILDLHRTTIQKLPQEISYFPNLEEIIINNSNINQIADSFFQLKNLKRFVYDYTPLKRNKKFYAKLKKTFPKVVADGFFEQAKHYYYTNDLKTASIKIKYATNNNQKSSELWFWYGEIHRLLDRFEQAEKGYQNCMKLDEKIGDAWVKWAEIKCNMQDYPKSMEMCNYFIQNRNLFYQKGKFGVHCDADAWFVKGLVHFYLKEYNACIDANNESLKLYSYAGAWYNKACAYSKLKNKKEMLKSLEKCFQLDRWKCVKSAKLDVDKDFDIFYEDKDFQKLIKNYE
jgi:tetratricopeptide (TPR) repeat protein